MHPYIRMNREKALVYAFYIISIFYFINCLTPLRLHVDTVRYFGILNCIEHGCPSNSYAAHDYLPYGYTIMLFILDKLHILYSFNIVFLNGIYLFAGLYFITQIFGFPRSALYIYFLLVLLNWTIIKFFLHPLSEMQYFFFSSGGLYFFHKYLNHKKIKFIFYSFIFSLLAFLTRTIGFTLVISLLFSFLYYHRVFIIYHFKKYRIYMVIFALLLLSIFWFAKLFGLLHYSGVFENQFNHGIAFYQPILWHFHELGEIFSNLTSDKIYHFLKLNIVHVFFDLTGVLSLIFIFYLIFRFKDIHSLSVLSYCVLYSVVILLWPFYDPRFWVPIFPIFIAVILFNISRMLILKYLRKYIYVYVCTYAFLGLSAILYSTYLTLNHEALAKQQANGVYRNEYEMYFYGKTLSDSAKYINPDIVFYLKKYN